MFLAKFDFMYLCILKFVRPQFISMQVGVTLGVTSVGTFLFDPVDIWKTQLFQNILSHSH